MSARGAGRWRCPGDDCQRPNSTDTTICQWCGRHRYTLLQRIARKLGRA